MCRVTCSLFNRMDFKGRGSKEQEKKGWYLPKRTGSMNRVYWEVVCGQSPLVQWVVTLQDDREWAYLLSPCQLCSCVFIMSLCGPGSLCVTGAFSALFPASVTRLILFGFSLNEGVIETHLRRDHQRAAGVKAGWRWLGTRHKSS